MQLWKNVLLKQKGVIFMIVSPNKDMALKWNYLWQSVKFPSLLMQMEMNINWSLYGC